MYELLLLTSTHSLPSLNKLAAALRTEFASLQPPQKISTAVQDEKLTVTVDRFRFYIQFCCDSHVLEESREIAEQFALSHPDRAAIGLADCRFELSSDDDPNMDHFNDMVIICDAAQTLGPTFIFDSQLGEFH
jgi:hypothetical protein